MKIVSACCGELGNTEQRRTKKMTCLVEALKPSILTSLK